MNGIYILLILIIVIFGLLFSIYADPKFYSDLDNYIAIYNSIKNK